MADEGGAAFGVEPRTLRAWASKEPAPVDDWEAIEQLLLAKGQEMAARGQTQGLVAVLTSAGISSRNRRYGELIRRREARRPGEQQPEPEPPSAVQQALDALRDDQQRLLRDWLDTMALEEELRGEDDPPDKTTDAESEAEVLAWVSGLAALSEDEVTPRIAELDARRDLIDAEASAQAAPEPQPPAPPPPEPVQAAPEPSPRAVGSPNPFLRVLSDSERADPLEHGHPSWTRIT